MALTVALVGFLAALLPRAARGSVLRVASYRSGHALAADLARWDRAVYHAAAAVELATAIDVKQQRLRLAMQASAFAVMALAAGTAAYVLTGGR